MAEPLVSVKPQSNKHLQQLVHDAIEQHGPAVDLNYIDVSSLSSLEEVFKGIAALVVEQFHKCSTNPVVEPNTLFDLFG